jgi:transcriptional regulator with XRE-family HTH domain
MPPVHAAARARRISEQAHRGLGEQVRRLREDSALTRSVLAREAGVDAAYLQRIEDGKARPSLDTYARLALTLGADLVPHLYPNTGPSIRDRLQARVLEALLHLLHPRWKAFPEVAVREPARGWIDTVLFDARAACVVATEIQSELRRLEQLLRWAKDKSASLPSWEGFAHLGPITVSSRLLLVRSTRSTRQVAREFSRQLEAAYPAHPLDAIAALTGDRPWPGPALIWVDVRGDTVRLVGRR